MIATWGTRNLLEQFSAGDPDGFVSRVTAKFAGDPKPYSAWASGFREAMVATFGYWKACFTPAGLNRLRGPDGDALLHHAARDQAARAMMVPDPALAARLIEQRSYAAYRGVASNINQLLWLVDGGLDARHEEPFLHDAFDLDYIALGAYLGDLAATDKRLLRIYDHTRKAMQEPWTTGGW